MKQHLSQDESPCLRDHDFDSELIQLSSTSLYDAVGVGGARVGLGVSTSNLTLYNGSRHSSVNSTRSENGRTGSGLSHYVHVAVRIRPLSNDEIQRKDRFLLSVPQAGQISVENEAMGHSKTFCYNQVFQPLATQEEVFHNCGITHLIDMAVNGYSCTTFAYGQTGSGKTHTITGPVNNNREGPEFEANWGLIQRSFLYLFDRLETRPGITYVINASYLEIYNEQVLDLLNPAQKRSLAIRWSKEKGFYVENLFVVECECLDDLLAVLDEGLRNRQTRSNTYNEYSSRSHSMLTLQIDIHLLDRDDDSLSITKHGKLSFVDLAGSEKVRETKGALKEANNINRSLLVLGNCISSLGDSKHRSGHVPYRDSKLTMLLADSLGGNGVTLMIGCVSPSSHNSAETRNTLRYANRAKKIRSKPVVKMDPKEKMILSLKRELRLLRNENKYLRHQLAFPTQEQMETRRQERSQAKSNSEASINYTPNSIESGLYEMLQEYMVENENLRVENVELHHSRVKLGSDHETLSRDNERLVKKLEGLTRLFLASPFTPHAVESIPSTPAMDIRLSELTTPESTVHLRSPSPQSWASRSQPGQQLLPQKPPHHLPEAISKKLRKIEASQKTYSQQFQSRQLHKSKRQPSRLPQPVRPLWAEADVSCTSREVPEKRNAGESTPRKIVSASSAESALDREVEEGAYHHVSALELSRRSSEEIGTQLHMRLAQDLHSLSGQIKQEQDRAHKRAIYAEE